jgi:hypothetical protein
MESEVSTLRLQQPAIQSMASSLITTNVLKGYATSILCPEDKGRKSIRNVATWLISIVISKDLKMTSVFIATPVRNIQVLETYF